ncbi:uncharacterized protein LOC112598548 isoform X2 [Melanaphis sacchari]|uniref:uncharacterized protein LOC112598548 isoform X2 n=1 Tax=Melanaphis sacchari TaxID=742174 RepID=UPI000DC13DBB|nr:uncharacterized protein LOC112598548 isoform X2 [Melanaphis sacchari]
MTTDKSLAKEIFFHSCINGDLNTIKINLFHNVSPFSLDKIFHNSPLHWCVTSKCIKGVKKLLDEGADFTSVNKFGKTPLQLAKITCLDIFQLIDNFIKNKNKDQCLQTNPQINNNIRTKMKTISNSSQFKITNDESKSNSKIFDKIVDQQSGNCETILDPDLASNNGDESFYLDISKLKHGDNSVLKLLEKSIEPVDETSFVSSILSSGKVIQLTEAGILALEYTKNEINTPIPDRLVQSFLNTSQQYNKNKNHIDNDNIEKDTELSSKTLARGVKRLKSPQPCSKKFKYTESTKITEFESLLDQLSSNCTKTVPRVYNSSSYCSQNLSTAESSTMRNNKVCKNQLVCVNSDMNAQPKWVDDLMCLLHKLENSDTVEHKIIDLA